MREEREGGGREGEERERVLKAVMWEYEVYGTYTGQGSKLRVWICYSLLRSISETLLMKAT